MNKLLFTTLALMLSLSLKAQVIQPVKWHYSAKRISDKEATIFIHAIIENGWRIYSQNSADDGPIGVRFHFLTSNEYSLIGKTIEPAPIINFDRSLNMKVSYFKDFATFKQNVRLNNNRATIKGYVEFMSNNDKMCLAPDSAVFSIPVEKLADQRPL
jgi:hypothetical protein